jgi:hypothetical protein
LGQQQICRSGYRLNKTVARNWRAKEVVSQGARRGFFVLFHGEF